MDKRQNRPEISMALRYGIIGAVFGLTFPLVGTFARVLLLQLPISISNMIYAQSADPLLWVVDTAPLVLGAFAAYAGYKQGQVTRINEELYQREIEMKNNQATLEQHVQERTAELQLANEYNERRAKQFEIHCPGFTRHQPDPGTAGSTASNHTSDPPAIQFLSCGNLPYRCEQ